MSDKERELVEYFIKIVEETPSLHEKWINPPIKITTWKHLLEQDKEIERLKEELEFEKATNKELLSTGADLENKLYEEQDKNKRLKKELQEEKEEKDHYQAIVESWE